MPWWAWLMLLWGNSLLVMAAVVYLGQGEIVGQVQDVVDAIVGQLVKVRDEIVGEIGNLGEQVEAAGAAEVVDLSGLQAIADALDAIVPDAVEEAEVEVAYEGLDEFAAAEDELVDDELVEDGEDR